MMQQLLAGQQSMLQRFPALEQLPARIDHLTERFDTFSVEAEREQELRRA